MSFALIATTTNTNQVQTQRVVVRDVRRREAMRACTQLREDETGTVVDLGQPVSPNIARLLAQHKLQEVKAQKAAQALGRVVATREIPRVVSGNLSNGLSFLVEVPGAVG